MVSEVARARRRRIARGGVVQGMGATAGSMATGVTARRPGPTEGPWVGPGGTKRTPLGAGWCQQLALCGLSAERRQASQCSFFTPSRGPSRPSPVSSLLDTRVSCGTFTYGAIRERVGKHGTNDRSVESFVTGEIDKIVQLLSGLHIGETGLGGAIAAQSFVKASLGFVGDTQRRYRPEDHAIAQ